MAAAASTVTMRRQVHLWLDQGAGGDLVAVSLHRGLIALICANVLESVPSRAAIAAQPSKLLALDPIDFRSLAARHPRLVERIRVLTQA